MKAETAGYLRKAAVSLGQAKTLFKIGMIDQSGRMAYMAAFQAAEAFIFERTNRVAKTHAGVHHEFARLIVDAPEDLSDLRRFLSQAYNLKSECDYGLSVETQIPAARIDASISRATDFLDRVTNLIG